MQVLVVDDHPIIQEVLRAVLDQAFKPSVVYCESRLEAGIKRAQRSKRLDLVVLDLGLPGCSRLESLTRFREELPSIPVVVISAVDCAGVIRDALAAGARGYIPKTSSPKVMQSALRLVAAGGTYVPPEALRAATQATEPEPIALEALGLSGRQVEVLKRLAKGLANRQIADELDITENTVKHHTHEVFKALGVATRTEALVAAMRHGLRFD
jgi:DNA-binding NarL/FixJ family response regulator